jgi:hypothetical protein
VSSRWEDVLSARLEALDFAGHPTEWLDLVHDVLAKVEDELRGRGRSEDANGLAAADMVVLNLKKWIQERSTDNTDLLTAAVLFARSLREGDIVTRAHCEPLERAALEFAKFAQADAESKCNCSSGPYPQHEATCAVKREKPAPKPPFPVGPARKVNFIG